MLFELDVCKKELGWIGHEMLQTKHWTLKYTDLHLENGTGANAIKKFTPR